MPKLISKFCKLHCDKDILKINLVLLVIYAQNICKKTVI